MSSDRCCDRGLAMSEMFLSAAVDSIIDESLILVLGTARSGSINTYPFING
jgi:hypothetical protein